MNIDLVVLAIWLAVIFITISFWLIIFKLGLGIYLILAVCLAIHFIIKKEDKK